MANKKITFGKPKTPEQQPAYIPEAAPENIDNRQVYDFGNKYAVLESKFKNLRDGAVYTAGFDVTPGVGSFIFTTTFFNYEGKALNSSSVEVPEGTPIESVELDYENKQLIIHTIGGDDIIADLSELIDKVNTNETNIETLNYEVAVGLDPTEPELARTWFEPVTGDEPVVPMMSLFFEPELNVGFDSQEVDNSVALTDDYGNTEQSVGFSETEATLGAEGETEQSIGFSEEEVGLTVDDGGEESTVGVSDTEVVPTVENSIELKPGFSDNEIK